MIYVEIASMSRRIYIFTVCFVLFHPFKKKDEFCYMRPCIIFLDNHVLLGTNAQQGTVTQNLVKMYLSIFLSAVLCICPGGVGHSPAPGRGM